MTTKIGIGYSNMTDSRAAGLQAASAALGDAGLEKADFAMVFCGGKHNTFEFMEGVNVKLAGVPKIGGSAIGIITGQELGYIGYEVGITVFSSDSMTFKVFAEGAINENEQAAGEALGKQIRAALSEEDHALLVFYDSCKQQNPPMMNFATMLFAGLEPYLPDNMDFAGGGLLPDMQLSSCYQFFNDQILTQHVVAVVIGGHCSMNTTIMHGCRPASSYLTITKTYGPVIQEIDNRPAVDVIDELLGKKVKWQDFALFVTLGLNKGEKWADFDEKNYANRLVLAVDDENKALVMFEPDLKAGDEVQLMRRSVDMDYIETGINELREKSQEKKPLFYFYINCAGRAKPFADGVFEDALEVQHALAGIPLMGFYSGVEVARVGGHLQPLDWTGVLCMFSE
jgi:hypothetical protein